MLHGRIDQLLTRIDPDDMEGWQLDFIAGLFLGLVRIYNEPDSSLALRLQALLQRNGNVSWMTPWSILDVFRMFFDEDMLYLLERLVATELIVNGDFETALGAEWTLTTGGSGVVDRDTLNAFEQKGCLHFDRPAVGDTAQAYQQLSSVASGVYRLNFFSIGTGGNGTRYGTCYLEGVFSGTTKRYNWTTYAWETIGGGWSAGTYLNLVPSTHYLLQSKRVEVPATATTLKVSFDTESTGEWYLDWVSFGLPYAYPRILLIVRFAAYGAAGFMPAWAGSSDTLLDRGDCESTTSPMIAGETVPVLTNALWARSAAQKYYGTYSYEGIKNIAAGTSAEVHLVDAVSTSDLHGAVPGTKYTFIARIRIPSSGMLGSELKLRVRDYASGAWEETEQAAANTYDAWQYVYVTRTIRGTATGFDLYFQMDSAAALNENSFGDDLRLWEGDNVDIALAGFLEGDYIAGEGGVYTKQHFDDILDLIKPAGVRVELEYWYKE
jgi:hypothetical protein